VEATARAAADWINARRFIVCFDHCTAPSGRQIHIPSAGLTDLRAVL
jgi:hypothetical protein